MFESYITNYVIVWVYHAIMYGIAMRILRANLWHSIWLAAMVSIPTAVLSSGDITKTLMEMLGNPFSIVVFVVLPICAGLFFYKLIITRFLGVRISPEERTRAFYWIGVEPNPPVLLVITIVGHLAPASIIFLPLFDILTGLSALLRRRRKTRSL